MSKDALEQLLQNADGQGGPEDSRQFLSFVVDEEEYGVDILRVQEIRGWQPTTRIPGVPGHIKGVLNLRGSVVPVIDLRLRFNLPELAYGPTTVVIVLQVIDDRGGHKMGLVVDAVSDVYTFEADRVQPPPDFGAQIGSVFLKGLVTMDHGMLILVDVDKLFDSDQMLELIDSADVADSDKGSAQQPPEASAA